MSDVFISYKREDEARVAVLQRALKGSALDVWWDKDIAGGDKWRQRILTELESAKCVLVVWSGASTGVAADFVIDEANRAKQRGTLLQVRIDDVNLPLGFGEHQALDLIAWNDDVADPRFQDVVAAARALIEGRPIPAPQGLRRRKTAAWAAGGIVLLVAAVGLAAGLPVVPIIVCRIQGVRELCGEMGIGGAPSRSEEALWSGRRTGDCNALRSFLSKFPQSAYAAEGQTRLAAARFETRETWTAEQRRVPLVVRSALHSFPSKQAAQADALARAPKEAQGACVGFNQAEFRLLSARAVPVEWRCAQRLEGHVCGFDGEAVCEVSARRVERIETCPKPRDRNNSAAMTATGLFWSQAPLPLTGDAQRPKARTVRWSNEPNGE
jgi:hypothetical protein